ncbi:acyl carrier protein [Cytobacillus praedii]|uniref:acyl carrier protein n=1 Tax=Cytobacillus praedii TaxID=1742358 RepID=UPI003F7E77CA
MSKNDIEQRIISILNKILHYHSNIQLEDDLQALGMDSMNFIHLIVLLEEEFDYEFPDETIVIENFSTIKSIMAILNE